MKTRGFLMIGGLALALLLTFGGQARADEDLVQLGSKRIKLAKEWYESVKQSSDFALIVRTIRAVLAAELDALPNSTEGRLKPCQEALALVAAQEMRVKTLIQAGVLAKGKPFELRLLKLELQLTVLKIKKAAKPARAEKPRAD